MPSGGRILTVNGGSSSIRFALYQMGAQPRKGLHGKIERIEHGQVEDVDRPFTGAAQLIEKIDAVVEELGTRTQERRFIQAFSADHRDFLKRYAELKLKIDRLISD